MQTGDSFFEHVLDNGLRIVIEPMPHVQSVAAGFMVRTGARDETPELAGVSHFVEHMCFKGTHHRSWRQITQDFDDMGSTYNAYTSKERTFYFGWVRAGDLERQLELLADMMRSAFPPEEFEMERKVILEEIAMSGDQIEHQVYDLLHEKVYAGHSLSWPVLGTTQTVSALTRDQLCAYFESRYHPANVVLLVTGRVQPQDVIGMAERICSRWEPKAPRPHRSPPRRWSTGTAVCRTERFQQQAAVLAFAGPAAADEDRETADVLATILGGHNSRFFWNIIQAGVAPQVAAGTLDYCDVGMVLAFGLCEPHNAEQLLAAMQREIADTAAKGVDPAEVQRVKNRTRTALAAEAESPYYRLVQLGADVDTFGRPRTVSERLAAVEAVTAEGIAAYLRRWPLTETPYLASLGPRDWPPAPEKSPPST
jgi:predicted Zn-dependent peptidase